MEGAPKFRPAQERNRGEEMHDAELERAVRLAPEFNELGPRQRGRLRMALALAGALGVGGVATKAFYDHESEKLDRPMAHTEASEIDVPAIEMLEPNLADDNTDAISVERAEPARAESPTVESMPEVASVETAPHSEAFEQRVAGYEAMLTLRHDQVQYLDKDGAPVGEPVSFEEYVGQKEGFDGDYLYTPGEYDDQGFLLSGPALEWREYVRDHVLPEEVRDRVVDDVNVVTDFRRALERSESWLQAGLADGTIDSYDDIVRGFMNQPTKEMPGFTRAEYLLTNIEFRSEPEAGRPALPDALQSELHRLVVGLVANESKFIGDLQSEAGARGIGQIMPKTYAEYYPPEEGKDPQVSLAMSTQVDVIGKLMSDNYHYIVHEAGDAALAAVRARFSDEDSFMRDFMAPLVINAYNAGGPLMGEAVKKFVSVVDLDSLSGNKDLFLAVADFAEADPNNIYGEHARAYVEKVYANAAVFGEEVEAGEYEVAYDRW